MVSMDNGIVNGVRTGDWTDELTIIASNEFSWVKP